MRRTVLKGLAVSCGAAVAVLGALGSGGRALGAPGHDLRASLLARSDLPVGFSAVRYKLYPRYTRTMSLSSNLYCSAAQKDPIGPSVWKQGMIQATTSSDGSFIQVCAVVLTNSAAAHRLYAFNANEIHAAARHGQLVPLPSQRLGTESIAAAAQDPTEMVYLLDFRHGNTVFLMSYLGKKASKQKVMRPEQFLKLAQAIDRKYR